ncbi:beta-lactamase family protein [Viridibacillus sp. YIM B01967]|uniref:Beta-lactamase family protein n=2 Tax=Viridibacillus soli TaxID=2798301 RepID=A0ABS1H6Q3_9BACL|nr:beta-lactamase family protein [Viridibacillus soli]
MLIIAVCIFPISILAAENKEATPSGIAVSELNQRVDEYVAKYIGTTTAGASVVIVKDGQLLVNNAYGYADLEKQKEVTTGTVFEWGSATKLLVWSSVMQLVEQGKLDLDKDIREYLPKGFFTKLQYNQPITMLNLMHHDAGWEEKYTDLFSVSAEAVKPLDEMLHISEPKQVKEPGEIVAYSNYGVALAGYIVEKIANQPFYDYVNENIFSVLDMKDTAIHPSQKDNKEVAEKREFVHGYLGNNKGKFSRSKNERIYISLYPAGSAIGTAEDAAKFINALMPLEGENSPLFQSNRTLNDMLTTSDFYDNGLPRNAHGFWQGMYAVDVLEHGGNTDSFSSNMTFSKKENLGVIVMTNQTSESGLSYGLPVLVYGDYSAADGEVTLPDAHELEGTYSMARRVYGGFTKLMGAMMTGQVKAVDSNTITGLGMTFKQITPYMYQSTNDYNIYLHFTMNSGQVEKVSMMTSDFLPLANSMKLFMIFSCIAVVFCVLYIIVSIIMIVINCIRNRKKAVLFTPMMKYNMALNLAGVAVLMNVALLAYRTLNYASYASLRIHFWINYTYIALIAVCVIIIFKLWGKTTSTKMQKVSYILSCVTALLLTVLIIGWELYK